MTRGLGQNYLWEKYPGEVFPEIPAHTTSVGFAGRPATRPGFGQNYLWEKYPGEVFPEVPAHTTSVGFMGTPQGVGACGPCVAGALTQPPGDLPDVQSAMAAAQASRPVVAPPSLPGVQTPVGAAWQRLRGCGQAADTTTPPTTASTTTLIVGLVALAAGIGGLGWLAHQSVK